ncbi:MAG TPA: PBP1A family penicillin-binding protein, partial [Candidatus Deferrimicrobium sp.]|nr:PBP1A family penicillin-binding protein [Candidatus Deferrimicrobium sp.]
MTEPSDQQPSPQHRLRKWLVAVGILGLGLAVVAVILTYRVYQSDLPSFDQLHNIEPSLTTKVYDRSGVLLKEFYSENRVLTPYRDFPPHLVDMLLASEDREYYDHWGINLRRVIIVAALNLLKWEKAAGASTVTQQLARMLFLTRERTFARKIKEALTAIKLERTYSKQEIVEMYLNQYYFGRGAYGIAAAARTFFSKPVRELNVLECATLIGVLKAPNINSPFTDPERALRARNRVLYSFYTTGGVMEEAYDSLRQAPLHVLSEVEDVGVAPYFTEYVRQYLFDRYGEHALYSGGLKVFTSLDAGLQSYAESALMLQVDSLRARIERSYDLRDKDYTEIVPDTVDAFGNVVRAYKKIQGAFVAIDNANGDILAMIGGRSFGETKFNRAVQALRQPGSAFKPFVYTACIDNGYRTTDIVDDSPIVLHIPGSKEWRPHNFDDEFMGPMTLRDALSQSRNLVTIRLLLKIDPSEAIFYARRMGITTPLPKVPSLAIGVGEVTLVEMTSAFSTYPNKGIHITQRSVLKIVDRYGRVLEDNTAVAKDEVLSARTAYIVTDMMRSVVDEGTARRARWMGFMRPAGGKTGTSDNFCDNWFVGYTPQITAGVWIGFDDKTSLGKGQEGSRNAVPVWTEFMMKAHDSLPELDFDEPVGIVRTDVCLD